jgi:PAS domain S-box-containing protein
MSNGANAARAPAAGTLAPPAFAWGRSTRRTIFFGAISIALAGVVGWIAYRTSDDALARGFLAGLALFGLFFVPASLWIFHRANISSEQAAHAAGERLRESQARLTAAIESMPFEFWISDVDGRIVMQNSLSVRRFGNQIGKRLPEAEPPPATAALCKSFDDDNRRAFAGEEVRTDYETGTDGDRRFFERIAAPIRDGVRTIGILGVHIDLTQMRRAQARLDAALRRLEFHIENSPLAVIEWDRDFRLIRWSGEAERIFGWSSEDVLDKRTFEWPLVDGRDRELVESAMTRLASGVERRNTTRIRNQTRSGELVECEWHNSALLDGSGNLVSILSLVLDVTARARAEAVRARLSAELSALHDVGRAIVSAEPLEKIAHATLLHVRALVTCDRASLALFDEPTGDVRIFAVDGLDSSVAPVGLRVPKAELESYVVERMREGATYVIEGAAAIERMHPREIYRPFLERGLHAVAFVPLISKGELLGTLNLSMMSARSFRPDDLKFARELAHLLATALDQSRLREQVQQQSFELERRVIARTARLIEVNEELENYVRTVSHDLRAPLRAIQTLGVAIEEDCGLALPDSGREYLARMIAAAERMDVLMHDLLAYSRLGREHLRVQPVDTLAVVEDARALMAAELEDRRASVHVETPLLPMIGHATTLARVVANLLSNAAKFVAPGVEPSIRVGTEVRNGCVRLWVSDNGIGVAPEHHERVFRVFERLHADEVYPGTGIGLAVVRRAVERMGGRAGVDADLGQGSRFWVELANPD